MISLLEIAQSINEDPRGVDNIDRSKGAEKKDQDADRVGRDDGETWMAPNGDYGGKYKGEIEYFDDEDSAKVYAKSGSTDSKGGEEKPEEPKGNIGKGDFERDFDNDSSSAGPDPDKVGDPSETEQAIASAEKLADKYGIESDIAGNEQGLNRVNIGAGGEYEGDNSITVNYDDGKYGVGIQGEDAMQGPISYMSFDSKEEMESALDKVLGDKKVRSAVKKGDSLEGMKDHIESLINGNKKESITINGKKYKPIKESKNNPQLFKEIYDRTFRSLK